MFQKKIVLFILSVVILSGAATSPALAYGGGGVWFGAGTISAPSIKNLAAPAPASQEVVGQVLGVDTFRFTENLGLGIRNGDVEELQDRLSEEGFYTGPVTGFFGPLTHAAVIRYQKANDIVPASGFVGSLTRAALNAAKAPAADQVAAAGTALTTVQRENIQKQINELMVLVNGLMERLKSL